MTKPVVSVIVVSYNTRDLTVKSIASVDKSVGWGKGEIEVIVVDNASHDDTVEYLKSHVPKVRVIANQVNKGFGAGNNQGIAAAQGEYVLLLNTDAFLEKNTLRTLVDILQGGTGILSVAPQLRYRDGSLQPSAGYLPTLRRVIGWMFWLDKLPVVKKLFADPYHVYDPDWYRDTRQPGWLMGACVLFRRHDVVKGGGFDEKIFMYAEEVELYTRLHLEHPDMVNVMTADTWATHWGSASTKKAQVSRLVLELKGVEYIYRKHFPGVYWLVQIIIAVGVLLRMAIYSLMPSRRETLQEYKKYFAR